MQAPSARETPAEREQRLRASAGVAGQEHLFVAWGRLDAAARARLLDELDSVDFDGLPALRALLAPPLGVPARELQPPEVFPRVRTAEQEAQAREAVRRGEELLRRGKVGCILVAGGQASRLGYEGPKGAFSIGPVSGWSLFEIHARRLRAAAHRYGTCLPWYVMTSPANDRATREFFAGRNWFGLEAGDVFFFSQAMMPAMDLEGRLLQSEPGRLFLAPNGHGGVLAALRASGAVDDALRRGLELFSYLQVDNPLAPPADPLFLGLHAQARAGMSSKVVAKRDAAEKVGVLGRIDGRMGCIEYSDLPAELREARDARGQLRFNAGNMALHVLSVSFVAELAGAGMQLPWHVARKRMSAWVEGALREVEGAKFECFVFDALGRSEESVTLEVERSREFSPVKNRQGQDSPLSAQSDLCRLHARWVAAAGLALPPADAQGVHPVEIDPLVAEDEEGFRRASPRAPLVTGRGHFYRHP